MQGAPSSHLPRPPHRARSLCRSSFAVLSHCSDPLVWQQVHQHRSINARSLARRAPRPHRSARPSPHPPARPPARPPMWSAFVTHWCGIICSASSDHACRLSTNQLRRLGRRLVPGPLDRCARANVPRARGRAGARTLPGVTSNEVVAWRDIESPDDDIEVT